MKNTKRVLAMFIALVIAVMSTTSVNAATSSYVGKAYMFTYDSSTLPDYFNNEVYDMRADATQSLPWLWNMNYDAGEYLNNSVQPLRDAMPNATILTVSTHGAPGLIVCPDPHSAYAPRYTYLTANMYSNDGSIVALSTCNLSNNKLTIFASCNSASTHSDYGNLLVAADYAGADCALGWDVSISNDLAPDWMEYFFQACYFNHATVEEAAATATQRLRNENPNNAGVDTLAEYVYTNRYTTIY